MYKCADCLRGVAVLSVAASFTGTVHSMSGDVAPLRATVHEIDASVTENRYVGDALVRNGEAGETIIEFNAYHNDSDDSERWYVQYSREDATGELVKMLYVDGAFIFKVTFHEADDPALYTLETTDGTVSLLASHEKHGDLSYLQHYVTVHTHYQTSAAVALRIWPWIIPPHIINCMTSCNDLIDPPANELVFEIFEIDCGSENLSPWDQRKCCEYQADIDHCMTVCHCQHIHADNPPAFAECVQNANDSQAAKYQICKSNFIRDWLEGVDFEDLFPIPKDDIPSLDDFL